MARPIFKVGSRMVVDLPGRGPMRVVVIKVDGEWFHVRRIDNKNNILGRAAPVRYTEDDSSIKIAFRTHCRKEAMTRRAGWPYVSMTPYVKGAPIPEDQRILPSE